jgi:hypothetical protein
MGGHHSRRHAAHQPLRVLRRGQGVLENGGLYWQIR